MPVQHESSLMDLVLAGQAHQRVLADPTQFEAAVTSLVTAAVDAGARALLFADGDAATLVGGALMAGCGYVERARPDDGGRFPDRVLVVGSTVVSGKHVQEHVEMARRLGSQWVGTWVWRAPTDFDTEVLAADHSITADHFTPV